MEDPFVKRASKKCVRLSVGEDSVLVENDGMNLDKDENNIQLDSSRISVNLCDTLRDQWKQLIENNVFRYEIPEDQPCRMIPVDSHFFLVQLNLHRFSNRRPPQIIKSTQQLLNVGEFNFTTIDPKEIVCVIDFTKAPFLSIVSDKKHDPTEVIIAANISPSNVYHYLIVPFPDQLAPQRVSLESLLVIIQLYKNMDHRAFVGFNGLGAYASVNHLHFHLHIFEQFCLPQFSVLESLDSEIPGLQLIRVGPFTCLLFQCSCDLDQKTIKAARDIVRLLDFFTENSIPYNLAFGKMSNSCSSVSKFDRVYMFIIPKNMNYVYTGKNEKIKLYPTFFEYIGVVTVGEADVYESITQDDIEEELQKYILNPLEICHLMAKFLVKET